MSLSRRVRFSNEDSMEVEPEESPPDLDNEAINLKRLGSKENGLTIIAPSNEDSVITILRQLDKMMQERRTKARFVKWMESETDNSVRHIQGGRMEIFLDATDKSSRAFDTIIGERLPFGAKKKILDYARHQALQDPRLRKGGTSYKFGNFSLICSHDVVDAQVPHLDLIKPNYQFGLMVSDGSASTLFFESDNHVKTVAALVDHWQKFARTAIGPNSPHKTQMTPALINALNREPAVHILLDCFGDVLLPARHVLYHMKKEPKVPTGAVLSLPGSVLHAAPAAASFRALIFFSGWPGKGNVPEYNPDTQYTGVMLAGHITSLLWTKPGVGFQERHYLLQRLAQYVEFSTVPNMWGHFAPGNLADFVGNLEHKSYQRLSREAYIEKMAKRSKDMGSPRDPFTDADDDTPDLKDYQLVSVKDLYTLWEEEEYHVEIHRRISDGKVVMRYPSKGDEFDEFEGSNPEENFRLVMNEGYQQALFDGMNGVFFDTEGEPIDVYQGRGEDI